MKKVTQRDQILLFVFAIFVILVLFYMYIYVPFEEKSRSLKEERETLKVEAQSSDIKVLEEQIQARQNELSMHEAEKNELEKQRMITKAQQEELLYFVGQKANELGLNLIKFEERKPDFETAYNIVGYDFIVRGKSKDLILFLNSLYSKYNYFFVTDVNLRKVEVHPTFENDSLEAMTGLEKSRINWPDELIELILMDIPPYIEVDENNGNGAIQDGNGETKEEKKVFAKELQLDFSAYFILADEGETQ